MNRRQAFALAHPLSNPDKDKAPMKALTAVRKHGTQEGPTPA